jgi:hypothetical protein
MCGQATTDLITIAEVAGRVRENRHAAPREICATCWERHVWISARAWAADPLGIVQLDMGSLREASRAGLAVEFRALAMLAQRHQGEFRELVEAENVLAALTGLGLR